MAPVNPYAIRVNDEDTEMIEYLKTRLGMGTTAVFRLAIRRLYQAEKASERKEAK